MVESVVSHRMSCLFVDERNVLGIYDEMMKSQKCTESFPLEDFE